MVIDVITERHRFVFFTISR